MNVNKYTGKRFVFKNNSYYKNEQYIVLSIAIVQSSNIEFDVSVHIQPVNFIQTNDYVDELLFDNLNEFLKLVTFVNYKEIDISDKIDKIKASL